MRQEIIQTIRQELSALNPQPVAPPEADVPTDAQYLFAVRYLLEKELQRISSQRPDNRRYVPTNQLTRSLVNEGRISLNIERSIRDVYSVCSPAIHGIAVTAEQVAFVRDVGPALISALRAIPNENV